MNTSFERSENTKVEWLTPPSLVKKLGVFDLDPCSPIDAPFLHAKNNFTTIDDGLTRMVWEGLFKSALWWRNGIMARET